MFQFLRQLITEADNTTGDTVRVMAAIGFATFIGLTIYNASKFEPQAFGIGLGSTLAAIGAAIALKDREKSADKPTGEH